MSQRPCILICTLGLSLLSSWYTWAQDDAVVIIGEAEPLTAQEASARLGPEYARTGSELEADEAERWRDSVHPVLRLGMGTTAFPLIGTEEDLHRDLVISVGGGILFCEGLCGLFLDTIAARGSRDSIVDTEWREWEQRVSFYLYPINIEDRAFIGLGIDTALSWGDLRHRWSGFSTQSNYLSLFLGLDVNIRIDLVSEPTHRVEIAVNGRVYTRSVLRECSDSGTCWDFGHLESLESGPFQGGGIELGLWIYTEFGH